MKQLIIKKLCHSYQGLNLINSQDIDSDHVHRNTKNPQAWYDGFHETYVMHLCFQHSLSELGELIYYLPKRQNFWIVSKWFDNWLRTL